ncbi:bifunctional phosphopantothenoylcysteine decarboxylase/phosphopantothenate--cysteine ligase CoaBC [Rickettsiales endosymbiont of Trichoplax sp. H2]|uniref:bifunctional phosphopantothenoylcysteine decarboxylase/phosphopantothenate--cysteine ligase CoaBC n=1 Tax=Rickettsiales endosymbiont of Trichoplax sp. H2 TaxID=2021221 RepID=UPI0012B2B974|nr:bifunctional phosphopantothenoylcysteine decarboxylase/phosphopantothenate--cysteine ligase CoaBC [Rickettsiales endosymbiont of Trichoplax sp. H2]MSO14566.1 Coenzyme A biosynthesis bifunctional protein CoaBC [Rickettsiales endosymbiont of Trichoplax sp. H2]
MKKILLVITGSIAAYKAIELIKELENKGNELNIILTHSAERFISKLTIASLSKANILQDKIFQEDMDPMLHIQLAKNHDQIIVAPASADFISKLACGLASSLSLLSITATKAPILLVPAMNPQMYKNKILQENLQSLKMCGFQVIEPDYGVTACGDEGFGRYPQIEKILNYIEFDSIKKQKLKGKKAIINLGSTRESIDPVRFIGNESSGEQGFLIASELVKQGCEVNIIAGYVDYDIPKNSFRAYTAKDMLNISLELLPADIYIGVAAICDFKIKEYSKEKIKKTNNNVILEFEPNIDVVSNISNNKDRPKLVIGFALESESHKQNCINKLKSKNLDLIIMNKTKYIGEFSNEFAICSPERYEETGKISKNDLAKLLVEKISIKINKNRG